MKSIIQKFKFESSKIILFKRAVIFKKKRIFILSLKKYFFFLRYLAQIFFDHNIQTIPTTNKLNIMTKQQKIVIKNFY